MSDSDVTMDLTIADTKLQEIKNAVISGDYQSLQSLLLQQSVILHELGLIFIKKSNDFETLRHKRGCLEMGCRLFGQARKTMLCVKHLES